MKTEEIKQNVDKHKYIVDVSERCVDFLKKCIHSTKEITDRSDFENLELARMEDELLDKVNSLSAKRQVLSHYMERYEKSKETFEAETKECEQNFDALIIKAQSYTDREVTKLLRLYNNGKLEILKDQLSKNNFYKDLKSAIIV